MLQALLDTAKARRRRSYLKARCQWKEPDIVRDDLGEVEKRVRPRRRIGRAVAASAFVFLLETCLYGPDFAEFPSLKEYFHFLLFMVPAAAIVGILSIYLPPVFDDLFPSRVRIYDTRIVRVRAGGPVVWWLANVADCEVAPIQTAQGTHHVLVVRMNEGPPGIFGLAPEAIPQVVMTLHELDVPVQGYILQDTAPDAGAGPVRDEEAETETGAAPTALKEG